MNWEPWTGCVPYSEGCKYCYYYGPYAKRYGQNEITKTDIVGEVQDFVSNITISSGESVDELRSPAPAGTKLSLRSISSEAGQSVNIPEGTRLKTINTTNFPSGIYLLSLNVNNQLLETIKISL